jgi:hypothetical protein
MKIRTFWDSVCLSQMGARRSDAMPFSKSPPAVPASHLAQGFTPLRVLSRNKNAVASSLVGSALVYREQIRISQQFRNKFPFSRTGIQSGTSWRKARRKIMAWSLDSHAQLVGNTSPRSPPKSA